MKGNREAEARRARRPAGQTPREAGAVPFPGETGGQKLAGRGRRRDKPREKRGRSPFPGGSADLTAFYWQGILAKACKRASRCHGQAPFPIWLWRLLCLPATQLLIL